MERLQVPLNESFQQQEATSLPNRVTKYPLKLDSKHLVHENTQKPEEFSIDDLLDFSNDQLFQLQDHEQHQTQEHQIASSPQNYATLQNNSSITDDFSSISVPAEELENLEWLSQFVEDSFCEYSLTYPTPGKFAEQRRSEPEKTVQERNVLIAPVQTKPRSKRTRSGLRVWPPAKKLKEKCGTQQPRRCSHCGVQKTPQWRAGPLGSKTLCNACGVRYKSGRLLPEYRPACSPTFSNELHSNSHRKVLEMRRKKEVATPVRCFLRK